MYKFIAFRGRSNKLPGPGYPVDVIYLDFRKAFDKDPHRTLLLKLEAHGISGNILRWTENWLYGRKQRLMLGGQVSEWSEWHPTGFCAGSYSVCIIY